MAFPPTCSIGEHFACHPVHTRGSLVTPNRCLIVKTEAYTREQVGKVVQLRAAVETLQLGPGVLDRLAAEGERGSLR